MDIAYMEDDWLDELRGSPFALVMFAAVVAVAIATVAMILAHRFGQIEREHAFWWIWRLIIAECVLSLVYAGGKAVEMGRQWYSERRKGFDVIRKEDKK